MKNCYIVVGEDGKAINHKLFTAGITTTKTKDKDGKDVESTSHNCCEFVSPGAVIQAVIDYNRENPSKPFKGTFEIKNLITF